MSKQTNKSPIPDAWDLPSQLAMRNLTGIELTIPLELATRDQGGKIDRARGLVIPAHTSWRNNLGLKKY